MKQRLQDDGVFADGSDDLLMHRKSSGSVNVI